MPDGIDQSWGFADPKAAKAAGVKVVSEYLSNDSSKNITAADVKAYHGVGIGMLLNWESDAGRPLLGGAAGRADATTACAQALALFKAVGYKPDYQLTIYFSCDRDVNSSQYPAIEAYYEQAGAVCHANGFGVGVYGEADLVTHLSAKNITDSEWQTYAWSGGVVSSAADFYQYQNGQTLGGASVDFDKIIHSDQLGAWWPQGIEPTVAISESDAELIASKVWGVRWTGGDGKTTYPASTFLYNANKYAGIAATVLQSDLPGKIAAAIVNAGGTGGTITEASIEAAVRKVFADAADGS